MNMDLLCFWLCQILKLYINWGQKLRFEYVLNRPDGWRQMIIVKKEIRLAYIRCNYIWWLLIIKMI